MFFELKFFRQALELRNCRKCGSNKVKVQPSMLKGVMWYLKGRCSSIIQGVGKNGTGKNGTRLERMGQSWKEWDNYCAAKYSDGNIRTTFCLWNFRWKYSDRLFWPGSFSVGYICQPFLLLTVSIVVRNLMTAYTLTICPIFRLRMPNHWIERDAKPKL